MAQLGAAKAGVNCISFDERDSLDALDHALHTSKAKGLIYSNSVVKDSLTIETGMPERRRENLVNKLMPELLHKTCDDRSEEKHMTFKKYPYLRMVANTTDISK